MVVWIFLHISMFNPNKGTLDLLFFEMIFEKNKISVNMKNRDLEVFIYVTANFSLFSLHNIMTPRLKCIEMLKNEVTKTGI